MYNTEIHSKADDLVAIHVLLNQNALVDMLFKRDVCDMCDIENLYYDAEECYVDFGFDSAEEMSDSGDDMKEIFEWWLVDAFFEHELRAHGEPFLITPYGNWWGRTTTGQMISMDSVILDITSEFIKVVQG